MAAGEADECIALFHGRGDPVEAAAAEAVGRCRNARWPRDPGYRRGPYDGSEARAACFLAEGGAGGGADPVGFLISSMAYTAAQLASSRSGASAMAAALRAAGLPVPDGAVA